MHGRACELHSGGLAVAVVKPYIIIIIFMSVTAAQP